jgi:hypothetical protein
MARSSYGQRDQTKETRFMTGNGLPASRFMERVLGLCFTLHGAGFTLHGVFHAADSVNYEIRYD